jgi:predicted nucleic acid-binding protein
MPKTKPKYYWDANIFIAWLKNEKRKAGEMEGLAEIVWMVERNQAVMVTSVVSKSEVLQSTLPLQVQKLFSQIFQRPNLVLVDFSDRIADLAGAIRDFYKQQGKKIKLGDAQHLATAIAYQVDEFHTFDEDDLIPLSGSVAGHRLIICKPKGTQGILFP